MSWMCAACVTPPGPHTATTRLEPGIPVREAGALKSNAKGYSL